MELMNFNSRIGCEISCTKSCVGNSIHDALSRGFHCCQICMGNMQSLNRKLPDARQISYSQQLLNQFSFDFFIHSPYVINLAGSIKNKCLAWRGNTLVDATVTAAINCLCTEMNAIDLLPGLNRGGVVLHPGAFPGRGDERNKALQTVAMSINAIPFRDTYRNNILLLETMAGQGNQLGVNFEELRYIYDHIDPYKRRFVGFCLDTCHLYASGAYELSVEEEVERMFQEFDINFGIEKLGCIHLNDSLSHFKSYVDRHAELGKGNIWGSNIDALAMIFSKSKQYGEIPMIMETGGYDVNLLQRLDESIY